MWEIAQQYQRLGEMGNLIGCMGERGWLPLWYSLFLPVRREQQGLYRWGACRKRSCAQAKQARRNSALIITYLDIKLQLRCMTLPATYPCPTLGR